MTTPTANPTTANPTAANPTAANPTTAGAAPPGAALDRALGRLAHLAGRRAELELRERALLDEVGRAKGRLALRPRVEDALERLQARAHERSVGTYERLLTGLVADVLPGERRIVLDLGTERGLPALDIEVERDGWREGIIDGSGGSLTNIVSAGLRFAALVRSPRRRFMALDEPDCWLAPDRVPAFCGVVANVAREVGVQTLFISHHDPALFGGDALVVRIEPGRVLRAVPDAHPPAWPAERPGIRSLRLVDFMSHHDTVVPLAPAVTAVVGPNNLGKSALVAALRAISTGAGGDAVIRHGAPSARVEVAIEDGRTLVWERRRRGPGKTAWKRLAPDGGTEIETRGTREVPDWVTADLGIAAVDGIDLQLGHQKRPVFLLDQPPRQRAQILSVGRESGHLGTMLERYRELVRRDTETVRRGEAELAGLRRRLDGFSGLDGIGAALDGLGRAAGAIEAASAREAALAGTTAELERTAATVAEARAAARTLSTLPEPPALSATGPLDAAIRRLDDLAALRDAAARSTVLLADLPPAPPRPDTAHGDALARALESITAATRTVAASRAGMADLDRELAEAGATVAELLERCGGRCPLCGGAIDGHDWKAHP